MADPNDLFETNESSNDGNDLFAGFNEQLEDFQGADKINQQMPQELSAQDRINLAHQQHPFLSKIAEALMQHPRLQENIQNAANYTAPLKGAIESAGIPQLGAGLLQGMGNAGISAANLPIELLAGKEHKLPYLNLNDMAPASIFGNIPFKAGEIGGNLLIDYAALRGLNKRLPRSTGYAGLLQDALKMAGAGFVTGESDESSRLANAILSGIGGFIPGITKGGIAENVMKARNTAKSYYTKAYNKVFSAAEKAGKSTIATPKINASRLIEEVPSKYTRALEGFMNNGDLRTAHKAQSDLGKYINSLTKRQESLGITSHEGKLLEEAINAQKKIRGKIFEELNHVGDKQLGKEYQKLTAGYKTDVVPYTTNKAINAVKRGELLPKNLAPKLLKGEKFQAQLGPEFPELGLNAAINKVLKYGGAAAAGTYAGPKLVDRLFGGHE